MRTREQALLWELWRLTRWNIILRTGIMCLVGSWVYQRLTVEFAPLGGFAAAFVLPVLVFNSLMPWAFIKVSEDPQQLGFPFPLGFTRPISTCSLVMIPMTYLACASMAIYVITAGCIRLLCGAPFPLWSVAVCIAIATTTCNSVYWSVKGRLMIAFCLVIIGAAVGFIAVSWLVWQIGETAGPAAAVPWLVSHVTFVQANQKEHTVDIVFSARHYVALLLYFGGALALTTLTVNRLRHGETLTFKGLSEFLENVLNRFPRRARSFRSSEKAQFWFEMRRGGVPVLLGNVGVLLAVFVVTPVAGLFGELASEVGTEMWCLYLAFCPIACAMIGAGRMGGLKRKRGDVRLSTFDAARPAGNGRLIAIKLKALIATVFVSWLMVLLAAVAWTALWGDLQPVRQAWINVREPLALIPAPWWLFIVLALVVMYWTLVSLLLSGAYCVNVNPIIAGATCAALFCDWVLFMWDARDELQWAPFWKAHAWVVAVALICGTILLLRKALSRRYLHRRVLGIALLIWAAFAGGTVTFWLHVIPAGTALSPWLMALSAGFLVLPLAPLGLAPLLLANLRHA